MSQANQSAEQSSRQDPPSENMAEPIEVELDSVTFDENYVNALPISKAHKTKIIGECLAMSAQIVALRADNEEGAQLLKGQIGSYKFMELKIEKL